MANPDRRPGKRGALPRDETRNYPVLEHFLRPWEGPVRSARAVVREQGFLTGGQLPAVPVTEDVDRASKVSDWPMYCNGPSPDNPVQIPDGVGDCTVAERCHSFAAQRVYAGFPEPQFGISTVLQRYSEWGGYVLGEPFTDKGCDPTVVLRGCTDVGIPDTTGYVHKLVAWAALGDPHNPQLLAQALETFGTVAVAADITQAQDDQFVHSQPWDVVPGSPDVGGHMFCLQRRRYGGPGVNEVATWGTLQRATRAFMRLRVREAYAVVSEDWISANGTTVQGLDMAALLNYMPSVR